MKSLLLVVCLSTSMLAEPKDIDAHGRAAFIAARNFHVAVLTATGTWPEASQKQQIAAKMALVYEGIADSLVLGYDLTPGQPPSAPVLSWARAMNQTVASLTLLVGPMAPASARGAVATLQDVFATLLADFLVVGERDEHPPGKKP